MVSLCVAAETGKGHRTQLSGGKLWSDLVGTYTTHRSLKEVAQKVAARPVTRRNPSKLQLCPETSNYAALSWTTLLLGQYQHGYLKILTCSCGRGCLNENVCCISMKLWKAAVALKSRPQEAYNVLCLCGILQYLLAMRRKFAACV